MPPDSEQPFFGEIRKLLEQELPFLSSREVAQVALWLAEDCQKCPSHLRAPWLGRALLMLKARQPYPYITESVSFLGMELWVVPPLLVPRPETEELTQLALHYLKGSQLPVGKEMVVVDAFTGSGAIALYLKSQLPQAQVAGFDCEMFALAVARYNARKHNLAVNFFYLDVVRNLPTWQAPPASTNLVVANPPYVKWEERDIMTAGTAWEHARALFSPTAVFFYEKLLQWAERAFGGRAVDFIVECSEFSIGQVAELYWSRGYNVRLEKDFYGKQRFVIALHTPVCTPPQ